VRQDICKYCGKKIGVNQRSAASNHGYMHAVRLRRMIKQWFEHRGDAELLSAFEELRAVSRKLGPLARRGVLTRHAA